MEKPFPPLKMPEPPGYYGSWRLTNGLLMLVVFFPLTILFWEMDRPLRRHFCQPATFMSGTLQPGWAICSIFAAMSLTWFIRYWLLVLIPSWQSAFGFHPSRDGRWKHIWSHVYLACFVILAAFTIGAQMSPFCLAPNQITLRYAPWLPVWRYDWSNVAAVQTACHRTKEGQYNFNLYYGLILGDGRAINLADSVPDFEPGYEPMMRAFTAAGTHPQLDSRAVEADCGYRNVGLLTRQP